MDMGLSPEGDNLGVRVEEGRAIGRADGVALILALCH